LIVLKAKQSLLKILVCDDDPADRKLARAYLHQIDSREIVVLEAGQRAEIQNALDKGRIDLVFMDIQMPEQSGMQWLAEIVKKQTAPVVMLTGSGSEEVAVQSLQKGAVGYLSKNKLSTEKLAETIDDALKRWRQIQQGRANQEELERLANIDSLTGLLNRGAILRKLNEQMKYAKRYREELSLSLLDIDHFKKVNDQCGHLAGDDVLEQVAMLMWQNIRDADIIGRYGGEEFIIILPRTDLSSAMNVAERVRKMIEAHKIKDSEGNVFGITVSQGISIYKLGEDEHSLISRADNALYKAKKNGRNRVETSA
jgi:two-component system cell cycle response regulator